MSLLINESYASSSTPLWASAAGGTINGSITTSPPGLSSVTSGAFYVKNVAGTQVGGMGYDGGGNTYLFSRPGVSIVLAQQGSGGNSAFTPSADGADLDSLAIGGSISANNVQAGNLIMNESTVASATVGTSTLVAGESPVISTTACLGPSTKIFLQRTDVNASTSLGELRVRQRNVGNFLVESDGFAAPGTPDTGDVSTFDWMIVNVF